MAKIDTTSLTYRLHRIAELVAAVEKRAEQINSQVAPIRRADHMVRDTMRIREMMPTSEEINDLLEKVRTVCVKRARSHVGLLELTQGHDDAEGHADRWYTGGKDAALHIAKDLSEMDLTMLLGSPMEGEEV